MHHPVAFADLEQAFDPLANVTYGAGFLSFLHQETGSWDHAVARYHSAEPERGEVYRSRVVTS
jgi:soluble lytic murein transglycosylase-like protein